MLNSRERFNLGDDVTTSSQVYIRGNVLTVGSVLLTRVPQVDIIDGILLFVLVETGVG